MPPSKKVTALIQKLSFDGSPWLSPTFSVKCLWVEDDKDNENK